jgi:hypothetical protein
MFSDTRPIREQGSDFRLPASDVALFGRYLFKTRWQKALSEELGISRRQIVYWKTSRRPVSIKYSRMITRLVGLRHERRTKREDTDYTDMVDSATSEPAKAMLLEMLAAEVEVRVRAMRRLARNGTYTADERDDQLSPSGTR